MWCSRSPSAPCSETASRAAAHRSNARTSQRSPHRARHSLHEQVASAACHHSHGAQDPDRTLSSRARLGRRARVALLPSRGFFIAHAASRRLGLSQGMGDLLALGPWFVVLPRSTRCRPPSMHRTRPRDLDHRGLRLQRRGCCFFILLRRPLASAQPTAACGQASPSTTYQAASRSVSNLAATLA